eukprot:COSAG05_NODE_2735_length_2712_cov_2.337543_6_plen_69_part_00
MHVLIDAAAPSRRKRDHAYVEQMESAEALALVRDAAPSHRKLAVLIASREVRAIHRRNVRVDRSRAWL